MNRRTAITVITFAVGYASTARAQDVGASNPAGGPPRPSDRVVDATIATRNTSDFRHAKTINPWLPQRPAKGNS